MNRTSLLSTILLASLTMAACRGIEEGPADQQSFHTAANLTEGTPEALGVLAFINDSAATLAVLDHDVPLPSNAAANVIEHRNGPDGAFGTQR